MEIARWNDFNSRPSARGDKTPQKIFCALSYFNSRPSARGDKGGEADHQAAEISIHAPPRGATYGEIRAATRRIFQFTLLREGRPDRYRSISSRAYFNSRPSARGDGGPRLTFQRQNNFNSRPSARGDSVKLLDSLWFSISIHAPPRGATGEGAEILTTQQFQFTPLREGRLPGDVNEYST